MAISLSGVPETMLWTLHNRATEAMRPDAFLLDPEAVRIYRTLRYDYRRSFGKPDESHAMRSWLFDRALRPWIWSHPGGTVVELACGLETQFHRCDDGEVRWLCVDLPDAIDVRERFLPPSERCRFLRQSALDPSWMSQVDPSNGVFVTAQGLFMYFEEADVRGLFCAMCERFPGVEIMFDTIPRWFSRKTMKGFAKTRDYTTPRMPWGISRDELEPTLRAWSSRVSDVALTSYGTRRGLLGLLLRLFSMTPVLCNVPPCIAHVRTSKLR